MKPSSIIAILLSCCLVVAAFAWPAFRLVQAQKKGESETNTLFRKLQVEAQVLLKDQDAPWLQNWDAFAKRMWNAQDRVLGIIISDKKNGIRYALPGASPYYLAPDPSQPGVPRFDLPKFSAKRFSIMLSGGMVLDALYVTLREENVQKALTESALALLVICAGCAAGLLITATSRNPRAKAPKTHAEPAPEYRSTPIQADTPIATSEIEIAGTDSAGSESTIDTISFSDETSLPPAAQTLQDEEFDIPLIDMGPAEDELAASPESLYHEEIEAIQQQKAEPVEQPAAIAPAAEAPLPVSAAQQELDPEIKKALLVDDLTLLDPEAVPRQAGSAKTPTKSPETETHKKSGELEIQGPVGLFDPDTTLGWESYLRERLGSELRRAASFEQDMVLLIASYDKSVRESEDYRLFARTTKDFFNFNDMAFLFGESAVAIILPNIDVDHAVRMSEELLKKLTFIMQGKSAPMQYLELFMGLSSRSGRLVDADRLIAEALAALKKARGERDTHIMAFRPDPEKFRAFLAMK